MGAPVSALTFRAGSVPQAKPLDDMCMLAKMDREVVTLQVGEETSSLISGGPPYAISRVEVAVGLQKLVREILLHSPPTPAELETAIAVIEDEVMTAGRSLPTGAILETRDASLWGLVSLIDPKAQNESLVSLDEVEQLFDLLAALAMGRPATIAGIPIDPYFAAALILLREMMHHLNFKNIRMLKP
jgi:hypothetical protein